VSDPGLHHTYTLIVRVSTYFTFFSAGCVVEFRHVCGLITIRKQKIDRQCQMELKKSGPLIIAYDGASALA
jgi:hypothetical protein